MEDNVDFFKKFLFELPDARKIIFATVMTGFVLGTISTWIISPETSSFQTNIVGALLVSLLFYLVPSILSAEIIDRFGGVTRRWAYMVSLIDQSVVFLFFGVVMFADSLAEAWQVMWLGLATIYFINVILVLSARGKDKLYANLLYPFIFPGTLLISFHFLIGRLIGIPKTMYLQNSVLFLVSAFLLLLTIALYDFIIQANIENLSVADFTSVILLDKEKELSGGIMTEVFHHALHIQKNSGEKLVYNIPWVHPGPVEGFGGGRLTEKLIGENTFFMHVPSDHSLDLSSPKDIDTFQNIPDAQLHDEATELIRVEKEGFTLWGRRYGKENGRRIAYIQNRGLDDYDPGIINEMKNKYEDLCIVDLHNQSVGNQNPRLQAIDNRAEVLKSAVDELMKALDQEESYPYQAGFAGNRDYRVLVEQVNDEHTCILGIDGNDAPEVLYDAEKELGRSFDEVLVFTTDTHKRLLELATPRNYDVEELVGAVKTAENSVSPASAGIGEAKQTVTVMGEQYNGLIFSLNIMARLIPISLILYYIALVFLIL